MDQTPKIYSAISKTMADIGIVGKGDKNDFDGYKYRGIDAVMNALNPAMIKNKIFVVPKVLDSSREERKNAKGTMMMYSILTVKYTFYAEDGSSVETIVVGEAMDRSDKSTNKAMSAAFKYACFQTFCIPTEEMKDSEEESPEIGEPVKSDEKAKKEPLSKEERQATRAKAKQEEEEKKKAEFDRIANMPIADIKIKALKQKCETDGVPEEKVCNLYKIKDFSEMTERQYQNCVSNWEKVKQA